LQAKATLVLLSSGDICLKRMTIMWK